MNLDGLVEPGWSDVRDVFAANFEERGEVGAAVCVYLDGRKVVDLWALAPAMVAAATVEQACGPDAVIMVDTCFGLGFMLGSSFGASLPHTAFGHAGAGGSLSFADPATGLAFGYVMNDLRFDPSGDARTETLVRAARSAADAMSG